MSHFGCDFLNEHYEPDLIMDSNGLLKFEISSTFIICSQNQLSVKIKTRVVLRHLLDAVFVLCTFNEIPCNIIYGTMLYDIYSAVRMNTFVTAGLCVQ
jgi:hypothetical protein